MEKNRFTKRSRMNFTNKFFFLTSISNICDTKDFIINKNYNISVPLSDKRKSLVMVLFKEQQQNSEFEFDVL